MLTTQRGRQIYLWINDDATRYWNVPPSGRAPSSLGTLSAAGFLVGAATDVIESFPASIPTLRNWLAQGVGGEAPVRIGFLDPTITQKGRRRFRRQTIKSGFVPWLPTARRCYPRCSV